MDQSAFGQYSLYGFPLIAVIYAFVKMGEAKTKKQNEILKALDEVRAEVRNHKKDEEVHEEESTLGEDLDKENQQN